MKAVTWKKNLWLAFFVALGALLVVHFVVARQRIRLQAMEIMGVRSVFPAGDFSPVCDAKNGWQGFGFARRFRFFTRSSTKVGEDFRELVRENFSRSPLQQDLDLFAGGVYVLQKAGKGYRLFCLFYRGDTDYWADMVSSDSLDFACRAFESFILELEIDGEKASPAVTGQILSLHQRISPFFMQTPLQLLGMMVSVAVLVLLIAAALNVFGGSCPKRLEAAAAMCTPGATLIIRGFGRRRVSACCLCREGEFLVIYRFRRAYMKINMGNERRNVVWEKNSLAYKNIRVILPAEDFQRWHSQFAG